MPKVLPVYILSALAAAVAASSGFSGHPIWFIRDTRTAVIALAAAGFVMCSTGAIFQFVQKAPLHALTILGYMLGSLALFAGLAQLFRWGVPYLSDARTALLVMTVAIAAKIIIARFAGTIVK